MRDRGYGRVLVNFRPVRPDGTIALGTGRGHLTGITWTGAFPHSNCEIRLDAARMDGSDFFAGITFPVYDSFCSWINGGWGGMVAGFPAWTVTMLRKKRPR